MNVRNGTSDWWQPGGGAPSKQMCTVEQHMQHLMRVVIPAATGDEEASSCVLVPLQPCLVGTEASYEWELHPPAASPCRDNLVALANVTVVEVRQWGRHPHQWQVVVSAGGVVSVLSNVHPDRVAPSGYSEHQLALRRT